MRLALGFLTIFSFVLVAVFGFLPMDLNASQGHESCIAAIAQGIACPKNAAPMVSAIFHINAFKGFSLGMPELGSFLALLVLFLSISLLTRRGFIQPLLYVPEQARYRFYPSEHSSFPRQRALTRWLALHENSPAALFGHR